MTTANIEHQILLSSELDRKQNFEHWRAAVASLFEATPASGDLDHFSADLASYNLGHFLIGASSATAQHFHRSNELVAATGVDHLLIQLYVKGECAYDADGGIGRGVTGDIICFDLSRPMRSQTTDMDIISLILPRSMIRLMPRTIDQLHGARLDGSTPLGILLAEHMRSMAKIAPRLDGADGSLAAEIASVLVSSALSAASAAESGTLMDNDLRAIQVFIERNLTNPALSTEMILRQFAMSRSVLYRLFEPIGGIADYIRQRRLLLAKLKLTSVSAGRGSVARLAFSAGFSSEDAFSRAFQQYFGIRPSEAIRNAEAGIRLKRHMESSQENWMQPWLDHLRAKS